MANLAVNKKVKLRGSEKAARFLMVLGEEDAAAILKQLSSNEVQKIGARMTTINEIPSDEVNMVLSDFISSCENDASMMISAEEFTRSVLVQALGEPAASQILEKITLGGNTRGFDALRWMEPQLVAGIIQNEHPQIQAIIISYLDPEHASEVLSSLKEDQVADVLARIGAMDAVDPRALGELNRSLEMQVEGVSSKQSSNLGGIGNAASILNSIESEMETVLLEKLTEIDADLSAKIQDMMFVFDDLLKVPDRDFQILLREVTTDKLAMALKGADEAMEEKVYANMSKRAAEIFRDDMEGLGPMKISDVEVAQKEILATAKRLADSGEIVLSQDDGTMIS